VPTCWIGLLKDKDLDQFSLLIAKVRLKQQLSRSKKSRTLYAHCHAEVCQHFASRTRSIHADRCDPRTGCSGAFHSSVLADPEECRLLQWDPMRGLCAVNQSGVELAPKPGTNLHPADMLAAAHKLPDDTVLFFSNAHRFFEDTNCLQGIAISTTTQEPSPCRLARRSFRLAESSPLPPLSRPSAGPDRIRLSFSAVTQRAIGARWTIMTEQKTNSAWHMDFDC
jgi:hypothetical protein